MSFMGMSRTKQAAYYAAEWSVYSFMLLAPWKTYLCKGMNGVLQTVEKKPREVILCREFANSVAYLNHVLPKSCRIKFMQWDFHMFSRR